MIGNILDNTTELYMIKYTFGEIFSSGGATLCKNPSDQTVSQQRRTTIEKLTYLQNAKNTRSIVEVWPQVRKIGRSFGQKIDHFELC